MRSWLSLVSVLCFLYLLACDSEKNAGTGPKNMYAVKSEVVVRRDTEVIKKLKYRESIRVENCNTATCFASLDGKHVTILAGELSEEPPPSGTKYVLGHSDKISPAIPVEIEAYNPQRSEVEVQPGVWIPVADLRDRPETVTERRTREKREAEARAQSAKEEREQLKLQREANRQAAVQAVQERRDYAASLRNHFLDTGEDIEVHVSGSKADRLTLKFVLFNAVWAHKFEHGDLINEIKGKGFRRVDLDSGYDYHVYWTFN
jgi:hypothetical protein